MIVHISFLFSALSSDYLSVRFSVGLCQVICSASPPFGSCLSSLYVYVFATELHFWGSAPPVPNNDRENTQEEELLNDGLASSMRIQILKINNVE